MKVLLVTVVTLTAAIVICSAADPECKERSKKGLPLHWPNPSDCGRFYRCTAKNIKREVICPAEREYNQKTGKCALRGKGVCTLSLIAPLADDDNTCVGETSGTFKAQAGYCRNYYICDSDVAYPQICPIGSIYSTVLGTCVPDTTDSCWQNACNGLPDSSYLPDDTSCLNFYLCYANDVTVQTCKSGSYFNVAAENCVPDVGYSNCWENFCLSQAANVANADDCHSYYACQGQTSVPQTCPDGYYFDKTALACFAGECPIESCTCPGGYDEGQMIPHPTDCTSFYICDNRQLLEQSCQAGNYFDCNENACVYGICPGSNGQVRAKRSLLEELEDNENFILDDKEEMNVSEIAKPLDAVASSDELSNSSETIEPIHVANANEPIESSKQNAAMEFMCMDRYFEGDIIADPDNCQQFKVCSNAQLIVQACNPGTYFDENSLICKIDEDGTCSKKLAAIASTQNVDTADETVNCTCPGGYSDGQFLQHPTNCSLFYICNGANGVLEVHECGYGHFYNEASKMCELDTLGNCWPITETNCTCPGNIQPWDFVAHPENCSLFYICDGNYGTLELQDCGSGHRFDNDTKTCVLDTCGICNIPTDICENQLNNTLIANPSQCFSFYLCLNDAASLHVCNATSWFDLSFGGCTLDTNATCRNPCENTTGIVFLPHLADCTKFYFCNNAMTEVESCDPGQSFNAEKMVCQTGLSNCVSTECTGQEDGKTFPVANDDTKFYYCLNGENIETNCLVGTNFVPNLGICLLQPSKNCNQTLCVDADEGLVAPTFDHQNASFCACRDGEAYLTPCFDGYTFDEVKLICYSDAPCDPAICPTSPDYTIFPNNNDSQSLCMCITNEPIIIDCPQNGTFNPILMACQLPVPQDPNCDQTRCYFAANFDAFPSLNVNDNTTFCICEDGGAILLDCPAGHTFEEYYKVCVSNLPPFDITKCQSNETFFPVPGNIYAFYYCSDATTVQLINCPADTVYDDHYKACLADPCDQTVCDDPTMAGVSFAVKGNPYIFCYCGQATNGLYAYWEACDAGTMFDPKYNVCLAESINPDCDVSLCANDYVGLTIPAINDTNGFCYCTSSNTAEKFSCKAGMKYDPIRKICMDDTLCDGKYSQYETIANTNVCNKYYLCFNGDLLDLTCANGTYFNSTATQCLPNDNNQCPILGDDCTCPGGSKSGDFLPHPTDCSLYYICSGGKLIVSSCGTNNYFDKLKNSCQPDTTNCCATSATRTCVGNYREGEFVPHPTNAQSYYICTNARLMPASCGTGNVFDRKSLACTRLPKTLTSYKWKRSSFELQDFMCLEGQKRSVPANCSQYELCRNGLWKRTTCAEYTYYNPEQQLCLEPRDDTVCAYAKVPGLPVCNEQNENALLPSKVGYCGSYLRCARGKWRNKNCPKQQYFAVTLQTCVTSSNDTNLCQSAEQNRTLLVDSHNATTASSRCLHTQVRVYERNCAMYFMCLEGEWWFQYCPLGMYFHPKQNYCVPNEAGQCATAQLLPASNEKQLDEQLCAREGTLRASAYGCEQFYVCVAGKWHQQTCAAQQYYNVAQESCLPADGTCTSINIGGGVQQCFEGSRRTFPLNCTAYERCEQGEWVRGDCRNNTVFDDIIGKCVPNDGSCSSNGLRRACNVGERKAHPQGGNCTEFYHCIEGNWETGVCLKGYRFEQHVGTCIVGVCNKTQEIKNSSVFDADIEAETEEGNPCSDKDDGVAIPHPNDCGKFYLCYNGSTTKEQSCTSGSFFDADMKYCRPNDGICQIPLTGPCEGQQNGTKVSNPNDCKSYYMCSTVYGTQLYVCPEGEYYHNFTRQCRQDHGQCRKEPTRSVCADQEHGARLPHELYCNIYYACVRGLAVPIECPDDYKFNDVLRRCLPDDERECQNGLLVDGSNSTHSCGNLTDGSFIVDKSDCTKYYICVDGVAQHKQCGVESFFDSVLFMCMADDGSCPLVDSDKPNNKPVPPDPIVCIGRHGDLMPDPANCNNFYVCINSKLRHERCYVSHFFNTTTYQCQVYDNDSAAELDSSEEIEPSAALVKQCLDQSTNFSSLCIEHEDGTSMAEQDDCRLYISCNEEQAVSQRCRNGESYDSILGFCRQNDGTCQLENGQRVGVCNGKHGQLTRDVNNCRGYFVCMNGQKIANECAEGENFSKTENMCQKDVLMECNPSAKTEDGLVTATGLICVGLRDSTYYPYVYDQCRSYFECIEGIPKVFECSNGMFFDAVTSRCVNEKVQCVAAEKPLVARQRYPVEKVCANVTIGQRYANPDDNCQSFYICQSNGSISYENCPIGMMFNAENESCEAADIVQCNMS